jgi:integrase
VIAILRPATTESLPDMPAATQSKTVISKRTVTAAAPGAKDRFLWDEDLPGFGLKITPAGRKVYVYQYRMGQGRQAPVRRYTIGQHGKPLTPDDARDRARDLEKKVRAGIDPMAEKKRAASGTVEALVSAFILDRRSRGRRSADHVHQALKLHVLPAIGKKAPEAVTATMLQKIIDDLSAQGSPVQARRIGTHLQTMFTWARRRGLVKASPAADLDKPGPSESRDRAPSIAELAEIWRAADHLGWPFGHAVKLLILTAQRRDEVAGIGWTEIDQAARVWTIPGARAKNGIAHDVHLSDLAVAVIEVCPIITDAEGHAVDLLFSTTGTTPISGWGKIKTKLDEQILENRRTAAIGAGDDPNKARPMPHWVLHDIRRGVTTALNDLGVAENVADRILNHASKTKGGVKAVYNRAQYAIERRAALALWSGTLQAALTKKTPAAEG